jgi:uncharacterized protein YndB with AHSA1/START domain
MATGFRRDVHLPAGTDAVWTAITDPDRLADWFGASVEWDLRPGGRAVWHEPDRDREGRVEGVEPGKHLRFRWWPADNRSEESEVVYELRPDDDGTHLTVTEQRVAASDDQAEPKASVAATTGSVLAWEPADDAALQVWAAAYEAVAVA